MGTKTGVLGRALVAGGLACAALAQAAPPQALPLEVQRALHKAGVPADAMVVQVLDTHGARRVLQWRDDRPVNPASLTKLLTTTAALERLGPAYTWTTPVWLAGTVNGSGVLEGSLHIKGSGDPKLVIERVWLLLRQVQQRGVREIRGDIVLDNSAFVVPETSAAEFDGEPLRPYNVRPAALLFNFRSSFYTFVPDAAAGLVRVSADPPLAGQVVDRTVPLSPTGPCEDWRAALKASFDPGRTRFAGSYALACGEQSWPVADPQPTSYEARLIEALWREMGGTLSGSVREGLAPETKPSFELRSPPLAELIRDVNKYSNNVMAQQLFLTLAREANPRVPATPESARDTLARWLIERTGNLADEVVLDNGSGLSRHTRISAARLAKVLLQAGDGPVMSELMSSLPVSGLDGTMRRSSATPGRAHLKTGSLRDVAGVAGYVLSNSGRRYVVVAIVNHPQAHAARPALDALVQWTLRDAPSHRVSGEP